MNVVNIPQRNMRNASANTSGASTELMMLMKLFKIEVIPEKLPSPCADTRRGKKTKAGIIFIKVLMVFIY
jgi:hypothetical protein